MFRLFGFSILLLASLRIVSAVDECQTDVCAKTKPSVDSNGKILLTVWYDNDGDDPYVWSKNMIVKACKALEYFKDRLSLEFIPGSGSTVSAEKTLICKHSCDGDRPEGCVALLAEPAKFPSFLCCVYNLGGTVKECAKKEGVTPEALDDCVKNKNSDQLLMDNGDKRRKAGIPGCHVPEFAFNNTVDRCTKIPEFEDLRKALCTIFDDGNISVEGC